MGRKWKHDVEKRLSRLESRLGCGEAEAPEKGTESAVCGYERLLDEYLNGTSVGEMTREARNGIRTDTAV